MLKHAGLRLPEKDLEKIFRLLDANNNGQITYNEFCDVIYQQTVPDYTAFVLKERALRAKSSVGTNIPFTTATGFKSLGADVGST